MTGLKQTITVQDLELTTGGGYAHSERPSGFLPQDFPFHGHYWRVWLGNYPIGMIWELTSGEFVISNINERKYKSQKSALSAICMRMNSKCDGWKKN